MSAIGVIETIDGLDSAKTWLDVYNGVESASEAMENSDNLELAKSFSDALRGITELVIPALGGVPFADDFGSSTSLFPISHTSSPVTLFGDLLNWNIEQVRKIGEALEGLPSDSSRSGKVPGAPGLPGGTKPGTLDPYGPGPDSPAKDAASPPRKDPLALDLDGDGIETTSLQEGSVTLFDHDGDGVRTGTGWLKPDDGWVVWDRNGNGNIDTGRELFGADTLKRNGEQATDGFDALADSDSNGDGVIDANDSDFSNLRVWQDANQDGISQSTELTTFEAHGIAAVNLDSDAVQIDLGNGNIQTSIGSFVRVDGTQGTVADLTSSASNLDLLVDTYYRAFTEHVPLTEQAIKTPDLFGSGRVRNLSEAISLSPKLGEWLADYARQTTRSAQIERLDGLVDRWASTSDLMPLKQQADALAEKGVKVTYSLEGLIPNTPEFDEFLRKLGVVERFMGFTYGGPRGEARLTPLDGTSGQLDVSLSEAQIENIELAYSKFKTNIYESLLTRTRLEPYVFQIARGLKWNSTSAWVDSTYFDQYVEERIASSPRDAAIDLIELVSATGGNLNFKSIGWDIEGLLATKLALMPDFEGFSDELHRWSVRLASAGEHELDGHARADLLVGTTGDDTLNGGGGNDLLIAKAGNDRLDGGSGSDTYVFGKESGNDTISESYDSSDNTDTVLLEAGIKPEDVAVKRDGTGSDLLLSIAGSSNQLRINDYFYQDGHSVYSVEQIKFADGTIWDTETVKAKVLEGTPDNDTLVGYAGSDTLDGGAGNDWLDGRGGSDTYVFGKESGNDTISESYDSSDNTDTVLLEAGIKPEDVAVKRDGTGSDLLLSIAGSSSQLRIEDYFYQDGHSTYSVEQIKFADGTIWDTETVKAKVLEGTPDNDTLVGYAGSDTLDGGAGNDWLDGRGGSDTYVFGKESGNDTISESYDSSDNTDTVLLEAGIKPEDVAVKRDGTGDSLLLSIAGSSSQLRIEDYFYQDGHSTYSVEQIKFADGTIWDTETVKAKVLEGTPDNDTLVGYAGSDTLDGGAGNDWLDGRGGSDTYVFGKESGNDTISESYDSSDNTDTVLLEAGIKPEDVAVKRDGTGSDLLLSIAGSSNQLRINDYFYQDGHSVYSVEQIKFADGTIWDTETVKAKVLEGTPDNDTLVGYAGSDTLDGGAGNDWLDGRGGSDTYVFGKESGNDTISESYDSSDNTDTVLLEAGIKPEDVAVKRDGTGDSLLLSIAGSSSQLRIEDYFYQDGHSTYSVEQIKFADGTIWDTETVKAKVLEGTPDNDTLVGYAGSDTLDGGAGNDWLDGRGGSDTYVFGKESGNDTISESYDSSDNTDTVLLEAGIKPEDVAVKRDGTGDSLLLSIAGSSNQLRINDYFYQDGHSVYSVEQIKFADGTVWDTETVKAKVLEGTPDNDTLEGDSTDADSLALLTSLAVTAKGTSVDGVFPTMEVWAGGVRLQTFIVDSTDFNDYEVILPEGLSAKEVAIVFTNDAWRPEQSQDRNLYVNQIVVNGVAIKGNAPGNVIDFGKDAAAFDDVDTMVSYGTIYGNGSLRIPLPGNAMLTKESEVDTNTSGVQNSALILNNPIGVADNQAGNEFDLGGNGYAAVQHRTEPLAMADSNAVVNSEIDVLIHAMASFSPPASGQVFLPDNYNVALDTIIVANG